MCYLGWLFAQGLIRADVGPGYVVKIWAARWVYCLQFSKFFTNAAPRIAGPNVAGARIALSSLNTSLVLFNLN